MSDGHQYTDEVRLLKVTMEKFEKAIESLSGDVKDIKNALLGTEYGEDGIVYRQSNHEDRIKQLESFKQRVVAYAAGIGASAGVAVAIIKELLF